jgi:hypothetical protein
MLACRHMCCRAPSLFRRFGSAGEVAVDLLARLLSFDPARRCSCEEAMAHEYFEDLLPAVAANGAAAAAADAAQQPADASMECDGEQAGAGRCTWLVCWVQHRLKRE